MEKKEIQLKHTKSIKRLVFLFPSFYLQNVLSCHIFSQEMSICSYLKWKINLLGLLDFYEKIGNKSKSSKGFAIRRCVTFLWLSALYIGSN